ncbi:hypothetical protein [Streptomyces sedi]|uniref:DUF4352 domain-containing protein n=1 Tax=Streptomyces sedi TaxID=555059 RepID=A0A5C4VAE7_9ACTN|nr:hypothetical protein [Streptomyces sedi]TNM32894.1 hypothetical protein FH715_06205 [Streptomyces sedi]
MTRTRRLLIAAATATVVTLTGCGSDDGTDDNRSPRQGEAGGTEDDLLQAIDDNLAAINDGDAEAVFASRSAACREEATVEEAAEAVGLVGALYGEISFETLEVLEFDGTTARVRGTTGIEALDSDDGEEGEGARWIWEEGAWRDDSCGEDSDDEAEDADEAATAPSDLPAGEGYDWGDGISLTVDGVTEMPLDSLGEYDSVPDGHTPFQVEMTIVNDGDQPLELDEFAIVVEGATNGGTVDSLYLMDQEYLEGRLAPGESKEHREAYSIDTAAHGRDLVVEGWRYTDELGSDTPTWVVTIP